MRVRVVSRGIIGPVRRPGFTLLDVVLALILLSVVVLLSMATVMGALRIEQATAASLNRQTLVAGLADQFRSDVARGVAAPNRLDQLRAGPACLILRNLDGRHVVYQWGS